VPATALRLGCHWGGDFARPPTTTGSGLLRELSGGGATTSALGCHVFSFFSCDYGANAVAECDRPLDPKTLRIELTNPDVLIGDVNFAVSVPVALCPGLRFCCRPTGVAIEEEGLDVHGRPRDLSCRNVDDTAH
jgi:hypothetical protein